MKVVVYSARSYDREFLESANRNRHHLTCTKMRLEPGTTVMAHGHPAVCIFVDDIADDEVLRLLAGGGTRLITIRATGFNNVDLEAAERMGMTVMRVREYSPFSVAEFAVGMILALDRRIHRAYNRVREGNFLLENLLGFDLHGKTVGIVGTGKIGRVAARILAGFGCNLLGYDLTEVSELKEMGMQYVSLEELLSRSDIVSLHIPLTPSTHYVINAQTIGMMKRGAMLINTSRGALIDTEQLIPALKSGHLGAVGLDVYEEESDLYFKDLSNEIIPDDVIMRLLTFPNVLITGHQAFFTREAMSTIAETTMRNLDDFEAGRTNENLLRPRELIRAGT